MPQNITLKKNPKIEFQLLDNGFNLVDELTETNNGFYSYQELQSIDLDSAWYPRLAKWLRAITWIFNGVPFFPDSESFKKAKLLINFKNSKLGIWLTDTHMTGNAKKIKHQLEERLIVNNIT